MSAKICNRLGYFLVFFFSISNAWAQATAPIVVSAPVSSAASPLVQVQGATLGSGFFIDDRTILTAVHIVGAVAEVRIRLSNGQEFTLTTYAAEDRPADLIAFKLPKAVVLSGTPYQLGAAISTAAQGQNVVARGFALSTPQTIQLHEKPAAIYQVKQVAFAGRKIAAIELVRRNNTKCANLNDYVLPEGMSGGPVEAQDAPGVVLGIAVSSDNEKGYLIGADVATRMLKSAQPGSLLDRSHDEDLKGFALMQSMTQLWHADDARGCMNLFDKSEIKKSGMHWSLYAAACERAERPGSWMRALCTIASRQPTTIYDALMQVSHIGIVTETFLGLLNRMDTLGVEQSPQAEWDDIVIHEIDERDIIAVVWANDNLLKMEGLSEIDRLSLQHAQIVSAAMIGNRKKVEELTQFFAQQTRQRLVELFQRNKLVESKVSGAAELSDLLQKGLDHEIDMSMLATFITDFKDAITDRHLAISKGDSMLILFGLLVLIGESESDPAASYYLSSADFDRFYLTFKAQQRLNALASDDSPLPKPSGRPDTK